MHFGLRPLSRLEQVMYEHISAQRVDKLSRKWDTNLELPDYFVPHNLKGHLSDLEIMHNLRRLGRFEENSVKRILQKFPGGFLQDPDEPCKIFIFGVNHKAVGSKLLSDAIEAKCQIVFVDISQVACKAVTKSLEAQQRVLCRKGMTAHSGHFKVLQAEIRNFLLDPKKFGTNLDCAKLYCIPMTLGYLGDTTASLTLEKSGQILSEFNDPRKENRLLVIGQLLDFNPRRANKNVRYYRQRDIMARVRHGAGGRKVVVLEEHKMIYFEEVISALEIGAK